MVNRCSDRSFSAPAGTLIAGMDILEENGARKIYLAAVHGVFSDVRIEFFDKNGRENKRALAEYEKVVDFLTRMGKNVDDYVKSDEKGFTVNALVRLQADPRINGIVFTDTIKVPDKNIIDTERVKIIAVNDLLATVCKITMTIGASLEDYQYEGQK